MFSGKIRGVYQKSGVPSTEGTPLFWSGFRLQIELRRHRLQRRAVPRDRPRSIWNNTVHPRKMLYMGAAGQFVTYGADNATSGNLYIQRSRLVRGTDVTG